MPTWLVWIASLAAADGGGYALVSAVATESLRFGKSGSSTLSAVEPYCRVGVQMLYASMGLGLVALALALLAFRLDKRRRKRSLSTTSVR